MAWRSSSRLLASALDDDRGGEAGDGEAGGEPGVVELVPGDELFILVLSGLVALWQGHALGELAGVGLGVFAGFDAVLGACCVVLEGGAEVLGLRLGLGCRGEGPIGLWAWGMGVDGGEGLGGDHGVVAEEFDGEALGQAAGEAAMGGLGEVVAVMDEDFGLSSSPEGEAQGGDEGAGGADGFHCCSSFVASWFGCSGRIYGGGGADGGLGGGGEALQGWLGAEVGGIVERELGVVAQLDLGEEAAVVGLDELVFGASELFVGLGREVSMGRDIFFVGQAGVVDALLGRYGRPPQRQRGWLRARGIWRSAWARSRAILRSMVSYSRAAFSSAISAVSSFSQAVASAIRFQRRADGGHPIGVAFGVAEVAVFVATLGEEVELGQEIAPGELAEFALGSQGCSLGGRARGVG